MKTEILDLDVKLIPFTINKEFRGIGTKSIYGVEMIKAKSIWQESQKGAGVKIAVIDSGCDINHESLKNNIIGVKNFTDEDKKNPNIVIDRVGHGTHVIGTICANGSNITGVAPDAQIYVLKAINRTGTGKLKRMKAYKSHILTKKSAKRKRNLRQAAMTDATNVKTMKKIMPYL